MDYRTFPIQDIINSGNIENSLRYIIQMQRYTRGKDLKIDFVDKSTVPMIDSIVDEMIDALPNEIWNHKTTFLNLACKDGAFVIKIFKKLFNSNDLKNYIENETERAWYILENQIFIVCEDETTAKMLNTLLFSGNEIGDAHITWLNKLSDLQGLKNTNLKQYVYNRFRITGNISKEETEKYMNFDVIIGNPPYNKGMDLDFVDMAYQMSKQYVSMITPAKWQTAEVEQKITSKHLTYGYFRNTYVPHMSHVCFYPDCLDVFGISQADGISWYLIDKNNTYEDKCKVVNKSKLQPLVNSETTRDITKQQSLWNIGQEIVEYLGEYKKYKIEQVTNRKEYTININKQLRQSLSGAWDWENGGIRQEFIGKGGYIFSQKGHDIGVIDKIRVLKKGIDSSSGTSMNVFTSDDIEECKSFYTWINSKFTRFFILINLSSLTILNNNTFRFVPAPITKEDGTYNWSIKYTDELLYKHYNIPQKYIDIIESIIKERK